MSTRTTRRQYCSLPLLLGMALLFYAGCAKRSGPGAGTDTFAIDEAFDMGPLVVHVRVDANSVSIAETLTYFLREQLAASWRGRLAYLLARPCFGAFRKKIDYSEYGGAPLLGVDGIVIIGHGRSTAKAVMNAIHFAKKEIERNINQDILETVRKTMAPSS